MKRAVAALFATALISIEPRLLSAGTRSSVYASYEMRIRAALGRT